MSNIKDCDMYNKLSMESVNHLKAMDLATHLEQ